jgi:hypothetical protein
MTPEKSGETHISRVMGEVQKELQSLLRQRAATLKRIGTIRQTIAGLAKLFGEDVIGQELLDLVHERSGHRQPGFTNMCRRVLMESGRPLMTHEVCQAIQLRNPAMLAHHKEPLASVSTVLKRLARYGEARFVFNDRDRGAWEWVTEDNASSSAPTTQKHSSQSSLHLSSG